jgi:hypothetical protein
MSTRTDHLDAGRELTTTMTLLWAAAALAIVAALAALAVMGPQIGVLSGDTPLVLPLV